MLTPARALPPLVILAALSMAAQAPAAPRSLDAAFGAAVQTTYPDGGHQYLWLNDDGAWRALGRKKTWSSGTWKLKGEKLCFKQKKPWVPFRHCAAFPADLRLGRSWSGKDPKGRAITLKLIPAEQAPGRG